MNEEKDYVVNPENWVAEFGSYLFSYASFRVRDQEVAEDLVQETFLAALESLGSFKNNSSLKTWLVSILRNKIFDYFKESKKSTPLSFFDTNEDTNVFIDNYFQSDKESNQNHWKQNASPKDWKQNPSEAMEQKEFQIVLQQCLENIPEKQANIFVMREIDCLSTKEICKELDVTESNIWVILHRVRTSLRHCLEKNWFEEVK